MKFLILLGMMLWLGQCMFRSWIRYIAPPKVIQLNYCKDRLEEASCPNTTKSVCGYTKHRPRATYSNSCFACSKSDVFAWSNGPC